MKKTPTKWSHKMAGFWKRLFAKQGRRPLDLSKLEIKLDRNKPLVRAQFVLPALIAALLVSLGMASLRIDLLRVRYALAASTLEEQRLLDESRQLTAHVRKLRDPYHLALEAQKLGFVRPTQLIDLSDVKPRPATPPAQIASHRSAATPSLP